MLVFPIAVVTCARFEWPGPTHVALFSSLPLKSKPGRKVRLDDECWTFPQPMKLLWSIRKCSQPLDLMFGLLYRAGRERKGVNMKLTRSGLLAAFSKDVLISSSVKQRSFFGVLQRSSSLLLSKGTHLLCSIFKSTGVARIARRVFAQARRDLGKTLVGSIF